jgi:hypothetical protein
VLKEHSLCTKTADGTPVVMVIHHRRARL